ncbi:Autolysis histidine kinase LytS [hydrothermal vent metagenome]|uniref:Autolysis histidine kinase LytS n=1 Tax=hydrothermal vent metagenome TaxID=652676 RepID=A0A3B1B8P6_9ZZZZ
MKTPEPATQINTAEEDPLFLPDFCAIRMVFVVVMVAELAAFVLALAPLNLPLTERLNNLGTISFFVQWCALAASALLCLSRRWLRGHGTALVSLFSFCLILGVITLVSEGAWYFFHRPFSLGDNQWHTNFLLRNLFIGTLISGPLLRYFYIQHQWRQKVRTESKARLQALQSRIRPHFLFNSMNTIASLTRSDPGKAEMATENLADLFRASLLDSKQYQTMKEELELCRRYLEIEVLRLGDRLQVHWDVDELPLQALIPPLLLQPLLENAIYHGIEPLTGGGRIDINGSLNKQYLQILIDNPLPVTLGHARSSGNQIALDNIRERLHTLYGARAGLETEQNEQRYRTRLFFPYITSQHEHPYH